MKRYKFGIKTYLVNILIAFFCYSMLLFSIHFEMQLILKSAFVISSIMVSYGFVSMVYSYTVVDTVNLTQRTLGRIMSITLDEIEYIVKQPMNKIAKNSIGVYSKTNKMSITSWTRDYKKLIGIIIDRSRENHNVKIDISVKQLIKNNLI